MDLESALDSPQTLDFETFWNWLVGHPNCILRAGTPEAVLYDDEDFHWHFASEEGDTLLIQVLRGKRLLGELLLEPEQVAYVEASAGDQDGEHVFELVSESESERVVAFFFVLAHAYQAETPFTPARVH
jgi:hypothetical protein